VETGETGETLFFIVILIRDLACEKKRQILKISKKCYLFIHFPILELASDGSNAASFENCKALPNYTDLWLFLFAGSRLRIHRRINSLQVRYRRVFQATERLRFVFSRIIEFGWQCAGAEVHSTNSTCGAPRKQSLYRVAAQGKGTLGYRAICVKERSGEKGPQKFAGNGKGPLSRIEDRMLWLGCGYVRIPPLSSYRPFSLRYRPHLNQKSHSPPPTKILYEHATINNHTRGLRGIAEMSDQILPLPDRRCRHSF